MASNFHFCPNCRSSNFTFANNRVFRCNDCGFEYYQNIASAVGGLIYFDKKVLFLERAKNPKLGLLDVPGGFVDPNETAKEALSREVLEEVGITTKPESWKFLRTFPNDYHYKFVDYLTLDMFFKVELDEEPKIDLDLNENSKAIWVNVDEISEDEIAFQSIKKILPYLKSEPSV